MQRGSILALREPPGVPLPIDDREGCWVAATVFFGQSHVYIQTAVARARDNGGWNNTVVVGTNYKINFLTAKPGFKFSDMFNCFNK